MIKRKFLVSLILLASVAIPAKLFADSVTFSAQVGDTILVLKGFSSPNSMISFIENSTTIGTTMTDSSGHFEKTFTAQTPGDHSISIYGTDPQNRTTPTINKNVTLIVQQTMEVNDLLLAPTLNVIVDNNTGIVTIYGFARPFVPVEIFINSTATKTAIVNSDSAGLYIYSFKTTDLEVGSHTVQVEFTGQNSSVESFQLAFNIILIPTGPQPPPPILLPVSTPTTEPVPQPTQQPIPEPPPISQVEQSPTQKIISQLVDTAKVVSTTVLPPTLVTTSAGVFALNLITYPNSISAFYGFFVFKFRRKKLSRGMVFDENSKKPVPFTVVRLFSNANSFIKQTVSDLNGKFGFIADQGKYRIEAKQSGYETFNENIELLENEGRVADNIPMKEKAKDSFGEKIRKDLRDSLTKLNNVLVIAGGLFSVFALIISFSLLNLFIVLLYGFQLAVLILPRRVNRNWGFVFNKDTNERIEHAFVRVLDLKEKRQIDVQITDSRGRFGFDLDPGEYYLGVNAAGYKLGELVNNTIVKSPTGEELLKFKIDKRSEINLQLPMISTGQVSSKFGSI